MSDNTPNFDAMTPEEIMAWMESLAKRQGASEGFTTTADMDVPEIDPSSVVIDEPGYIPPETSKSAKLGGKMPAAAPTSRPETAAPIAPAAARPSQPAPRPVEQQPTAAELPLFEHLKADKPTPPPKPQAETASLSWLESLAADQSGGLPEIDLSALAADLTPAAPPSAPVTNPINWLENLAQGQGDEIPMAAEPTDPMDWLESLARRQGVRDEELTTPADMDVPLPGEPQFEGPGYTDYAFDTPTGKPAGTTPPRTPSPFVTSPEPEAAQDPAAWLDALASASSTKRIAEPQPMSDAEIQAALKRGEMIPQDQMEAWMNRQLEIGAQRPEPVAEEEDAPAVKAELPDWLIDQIGQPVFEETPKAPETPALIDAILEPPPVATSEIPDWLREDESAVGELDSIFASTDTPPQESWSETRGFAPEAQVEAPSVVFDQSDPWVEAFEQEYREKQGVPLEVQSPVAETPTLLQKVEFEPETELPEGVIEEVPDWLAGVIGDEAEVEPAEDIPDWLKQDIGGVLPVEAEPAVAASVPDWLADVDIAAEEIPEWLTQSITGEQTTVLTPAPAAAVIPAPAFVPVSPIPSPVEAAVDIPGTLSRARSLASSNDLDSSLTSYEQLIRANAELETVVSDLTSLAEKIKTSAAVLRVLGDGLMRQGKLQAALDTYRKALNQL
jgi:hypothetical protein